MGRAAADNRSRGKSYSNANAATPRAGSAIGKHKSFSRKGWQCKRLSFGRSHRPFSFSGKKMGGVLLRRARRTSLRAARGESVKYLLDKKSPAWYAERNKGSEKEAFSFHPLKRGDGRCKSLRNGKGGAFEPRGGNAAPVPPLQGNEVPRIQRGIQVEPRTIALFALSLLFIGSGRFLSPEPDIERRNSP